MKNKVIKIFIFARSGSKEILNKNLRKINKKSLVEHSIRFAKKITKEINIFVSTDDDKIKIISKNLNVHVINRPKKLAHSKSPEILSWKHAVKFLNNKKIEFDLFVSLPPTSPLRKKKDVINTIKKLRGKTDIVLTATKADRNPSFNMVKKLSNGYYGIVVDSKRIFNRQQAPSVYDLNTVAFVTTPKYVLKCKNIFDGKVDINVLEKSNSIDIDSLYDLKIARYLSK
jgi:CMP-N-acetylneuraminic acid synthetase